jgi:hypothetical protein
VSAVATLPPVHPYPAPTPTPDPAMGAEPSNGHSIPPSIPMMVQSDPAPVTFSKGSSTNLQPTVAAASSESNTASASANDWIDSEIYRQGAMAMNGTPLQVVSHSIAKSEDRINAWARKNHATVLSDDESKEHRGVRIMVVELQPQQVTTLIRHLNAEETQEARLAPEMMSMSNRSALASPMNTVTVETSTPKPGTSLTPREPAAPVTIEPVKSEPMKPIYLTVILSQ